MGRSTIEAQALPAKGQRSAGSWQSAPVRTIRQLIAWIRSERRKRREIDELMALDDRLLSDIGLSREHIEYAARYGRLPTRWNDGLPR